jgi:hypothetical protein
VGVPKGTTTLAVMLTGLPAVGFTVAPGVRLHVAPVIGAEQETATLWLNDPDAVI